MAFPLRPLPTQHPPFLCLITLLSVFLFSIIPFLPSLLCFLLFFLYSCPIVLCPIEFLVFSFFMAVAFLFYFAFSPTFLFIIFLSPFALPLFSSSPFYLLGLYGHDRNSLPDFPFYFPTNYLFFVRQVPSRFFYTLFTQKLVGFVN